MVWHGVGVPDLTTQQWKALEINRAATLSHLVLDTEQD
jgi:hypothetical protein